MTAIPTDADREKAMILRAQIVSEIMKLLPGVIEPSERKPTIEELEKILNSEDHAPATINPDGSIGQYRPAKVGDIADAVMRIVDPYVATERADATDKATRKALEDVRQALQFDVFRFENSISVTAQRIIARSTAAQATRLANAERERDEAREHQMIVCGQHAEARRVAETALATAQGQLAERYEVQQKWLLANAPRVAEEQKHLDDGSTERNYWHYGYCVALRDVIALFAARAAGKGTES